MTIHDLQVLVYIIEQSKGWPVGIPVSPYRAKRLVDQGYAEYAPCSYIHLIKKRVSSIRATVSGIVYVNGTGRSKKCGPTMQTLKTG